MSGLAIFLFVVLATSSVQSLTCNEGFNISIAGVPLQYWVEGKCSNKSECFMQEIQTEIYSTGLEVASTYGGCISSSYSRIITCQTLFGENSTLNPTVLINMIPKFQDKLYGVVLNFWNDSSHLKELFSNGKGREEFVAGCYKFLENLGFNTEKAIPLQKPFTDLLDIVLYRPNDYEDRLSQMQKINAAFDKILVTLGKLDTTNSDISESIYYFFDNWNLQIRGSKYAPLVENLPELIRSLLPEELKPQLWFDAVFDVMGVIDLEKPTQTTQDIVTTIKKYWQMPPSEEKYINFFLDIIPGIVDVAETQKATVLLTVLKRDSTQNTKTERLIKAATRIIRSFYRGYSLLPSDTKLVLDWVPGLAYHFFPEDVAEINRVYDVLSDGLEALDFSNPTETMKRTNMSDFILFITEKTGLFYPIVRGHKESKQMNDLIIINTARTIYNLIPEYADKIDNVFSGLLQILEFYPYFNATRLFENFGAKVPAELRPVFDNIENVLKTVYNESGMNFKLDEFVKEANLIIAEYKDMYPESDLPVVIEKYVNFLHKLDQDEPSEHRCNEMVTDWSNQTQTDAYFNCTNDYYNKMAEIRRQASEESLNISIELQFAVFKAIDPDNIVFKALVKAFPDFELYIRAMRLLEPSDIQELYVDYLDWAYSYTDYNNRQPMTLERLLWMMNSTMTKVMTKLQDVVKDVRILLSPDSCRYMTCGDDLCNVRNVLNAQELVTRDPRKRKFGQLPTWPTVIKDEGEAEKEKSDKKQEQLVTPQGGFNETTSSSARNNPTLLLNALAALLIAKFAA